MKRKRLFSTSDCSVSRSASHTSSAASSVQPPAKTARRANSSLLLGSEQVVAPVDGRAQRAAARGSASRPPVEQVEALRKPFEDLRAARARFVRGRSQLDREGEVVEAAAELGDLLGRLESAEPRRHRRVRCPRDPRQRRDRILDLGPDTQELAARDEQLQVGTSARQDRRVRAPPRPPARSCRGRGVARCSAMCAARPSLAPSVCAIVSVTSVGSRREASPTQNTPSGKARAASAAARSAEARLAGASGPGQREQPTSSRPRVARRGSCSSRSRPRKDVGGAGDSSRDSRASSAAERCQLQADRAVPPCQGP